MSTLAFAERSNITINSGIAHHFARGAIPQLKRLKPKIQVEAVLKAVSEEFGCDQEQIITKGRKKNKAREVTIYIARDLSGITC